MFVMVPISLYPVVRRCNHVATFSSSLPCQKPQVCRRNFDDVYHTFGDTSISGLIGHIASFGRRSSSKSFGDTLVELVAVDSGRSAVERKQLLFV